MFNWFWKLLLLLFCVDICSETTSIVHVPGIQGGNATLPCEFEARDIFDVILRSLSKNIPVCKTEECSGRVFKKGACDIEIKDLRLNDAGNYILRVFYHNNQTELKQQTREYHLHIDAEISGKTGEELKMDVLLTNAYKVKTNSSGVWREVWNKRDGVLDHHLTDADGNLTINNFTASDAGTYRVLDAKDEILITVTVTGTASKEKRDNAHDDKPDDTKQHTVVIAVLSVLGVLVLVLGLIIFVIMKRQRRHRNQEHDAYQGVPMQEIIREAQNN